MNETSKWTIVLSLLSAPVCAQQPPDVVVSDAHANTAMGTNALLSYSGGVADTAAGSGALEYFNGSGNTAVGATALAGLATSGTGLPAYGGDNNTAVGNNALSMLDGNNNTAVGSNALVGGPPVIPHEGIGNDNTAIGASALENGFSGSANTAAGVQALADNGGSYNTAVGYQTMAKNLVGNYTTAVGSFALQANTLGGYDTAFGALALSLNSNGSGNTAFGYAGLRSNTTGSNNIGFGYQTMYLNSTGSNNIAMGYQGGYNVLNGSNTIEIGNLGAYADENLIRIGTQGTQTKAYLAGISGAQVTGSAVYVTPSGQLGVLASSERYKTGVAPIGQSSRKLQQLRPVTYHLKADPNGVAQYGLIAEEVDKVYPELVIRDTDGVIQGVRYEELAPMLLNELQRQAAQIKALQAQADEQAQRALSAQRLLAELKALKQELRSAHAMVAQR